LKAILFTAVSFAPRFTSGQAAPTPRNNAGIAFDATKKVIVVYGGSAHTRSAIQMRDSAVWEWNGSSWKKRTTAPSLRADGGFVCDPKNGALFIAGGSFSYSASKSANYDDTWKFDGNKWTYITSTNFFKDLFHGAYTYNPEAKSVMLFSGFNVAQNAVVEETWLLTSNVWMQTQTGNVPPARFLHSIFYDPKNDATILVGGADLNNNAYREMWMLKGNQWTVVDKDIPVHVMNSHGATAIGKSGKYILIKSSYEEKVFETWIWDGTLKSWMQVKGKQPFPSDYPSIAYDEKRKCAVLFGGQRGIDSTNEVWELADGATDWVKRF